MKLKIQNNKDLNFKIVKRPFYSSTRYNAQMPYGLKGKETKTTIWFGDKTNLASWLYYANSYLNPVDLEVIYLMGTRTIQIREMKKWKQEMRKMTLVK